MRKVLVPKPVSQYLGSLGLPRAILLEALTRIHNEMAPDYPRFRSRRIPGREDSQYRYWFVLRDDSGVKHLFTFAVDDATSPDNLIIVSVRHDTR